jgi:AcrR family transcriptional regulator
MRVTDVTAPSVASTARRAQIVAATVEVIAAEGFQKASFARIADQAGLSSTRLISYHFANKDELIGAVVQDVLGSIGRYVGGRIDAAEKATSPGNATAILRAYVEGSIGFIATHRSHMQALLQIVLSGGGLPTGEQAQPTATPLEGLLRHGQKTGEFRSFDVSVVAAAIQRAIEGLPFMLAAQPDLDCDRYASELVDLYLRGVRKDQP